MNALKRCFLCDQNANVTENPQGRDSIEYKCANCGRYTISNTALSCSEALNTSQKAVLSYWIRKTQSMAGGVQLNTNNIKDVLESTQLPSPDEVMDNMLEYIGERCEGVTETCIFNDTSIASVGARNHNDWGVLYNHLEQEEQLIKVHGSMSPPHAQLTIKGWRKYGELKKQRKGNKRAFMAMPYSSEEEPTTETLEAMFKCFSETIEKKTGFELRRLDDRPEAGSIDHRLRVDIRRARFLVADLTHRNSGAYWEAGFGEGLGIPVIYTCEKQCFEDKKMGPHFDTRQMQTIIWGAGNLNEAAEKLVDTIRNTFPDEARMEPA